jgi:hypothetical protein
MNFSLRRLFCRYSVFFTAPMRAFFSLIGGFDSQFLGSKTHSRILICRKIVSISIGAPPDSSMGMPEAALPCGSVGGSFAWDPRIRSSCKTFDPTNAEMVGYRRRARTQTAIRTIRDPRSGKVPRTDPRKSVEGGDWEKIKSLIKEGRGAW